MPARLHPGVYVEEVPNAARAIEAVGTSTAIFVGDTERGPLEPTLIKGRADYERLFGGYLRHATGGGTNVASLVYAIDAFFQNGGSSAYVLRALTTATTGTRNYASGQDTVTLEASSPGIWSSNLSAVFCSPKVGTQGFRIVVLYKPPGSNDPQIVEDWDRLSTNAADENYVVDVLKRSLYIRWSSTLVAAPTSLLAPGTDVTTAFSNNTLNGTGGDTNILATNFPLSRLDEITDASLLVIPARIGGSDAIDLAKEALDYAEARPQQDLFCIADMPRQAGADATTATAATKTAWSTLTNKTTFGALYFPWVEISDPAGAGRDPTLFVPPSVFVAGIYARTDGRRGVWKAPAGLDATMLGMRKLEQKLLDGHQDELNPLGINAIRVQPTGGAVVWGARTMRPDSEWRYVPVRRMAIFLRRSIYNGIQWAVFEPNDETLWSSLRLTISSFMEQMFRQGAFAGKTTREAFFVKCDAETTPEADQIAGIVNVWAGFAPLRPAEFVVVKLSQMVNQKA